MPTNQINGVTIHYEAEGSGEPVLFVHGLGGCLENWANQARFFSGRYGTIRMDLRGFGKSDCPVQDDAYSVEIFSNDILGFIDRLELETIHLVGTSMGGYVSLCFSLTHADRVKSLALCHTSCRRSVPIDILNSRIKALETVDMKEYARLVVSQAVAEGTSQALIDTIVDSVAQNSKDAYMRVISKGLTGFDVCDRLQEIRIPTLVIGGEKDRVIPPDRSVELHERIPGSRLTIIPNVGHLSYLERPEEFNRILMGFLDLLDTDENPEEG